MRYKLYINKVVKIYLKKGRNYASQRDKGRTQPCLKMPALESKPSRNLVTLRQQCLS